VNILCALFVDEETGMEIYSRPYRDSNDLARMRQLLVVGSQAKIPASYMHPGFFDLETHYPPDDEIRRRNIWLWEHASERHAALAAWAFFIPSEEAFDVFMHPAQYGSAMHQIVLDGFTAWAEARAREVGLTQLQTFSLLEHDEVTGRLLVERGFTLQPSRPPFFERALDALPVMRLPEGYTVQGVTNVDEGRLRAAVTHAAFRREDAWDGYWANYARYMNSAVYDGARDLFVRAPDGRGAAACTIWYDHVNRVGLFEPVATHPDYQRKGLGKAVMAEGLRRMQAAGMQRAYVGTDPSNVAACALYQSMGFQTTMYYAMYRKELAAIRG
jgi:GNAT superfamily N-acetyltransferase